MRRAFASRPGGTTRALCSPLFHRQGSGVAVRDHPRRRSDRRGGTSNSIRNEVARRARRLRWGRRPPRGGDVPTRHRSDRARDLDRRTGVRAVSRAALQDVFAGRSGTARLNARPLGESPPVHGDCVQRGCQYCSTVPPAAARHRQYALLRIYHRVPRCTAASRRSRGIDPQPVPQPVEQPRRPAPPGATRRTPGPAPRLHGRDPARWSRVRRPSTRVNVAEGVQYLHPRGARRRLPSHGACSPKAPSPRPTSTTRG